MDALFNHDVISSYFGAALALVSAAFVWLIKTAVDKHKKEKLALAKIERSIAFGFEGIKNNFEFIDKWLQAIENNRPYSFYIEDFTPAIDETFNTSNLILIRKVLWLNYKFKRTCADLQNLYKSYWETLKMIETIPNAQAKEENLRNYHLSVTAALKSMRPNYAVLEDEVIDVMATIQSLANVRKHSLFGYLDYLFTDVYPRLTEKDIDRRKIRIGEEIRQKKENHKPAQRDSD